MPTNIGFSNHYASKKPPIGLTPKKFWEENIKVSRLIDITDAISRYSKGRFEIPIEWVEEYNDLIKQI